MKLGDDEQKVGEYYFKDASDVANMSVLTNRRLVIVYANAEESYPLSKITAVKVIFNRNLKLLIAGGVIALVGLLMLGSNAGSGLVAIVIGAGLGYLGWIGKTVLEIGQMGGHKLYKVRGQSQSLRDFIEAVNSKLA
jgi:hypothetical protein